MLASVAATTLSWQAGAASSLVAGPVAGRSPLRAAVRAAVDDKAEVEEYFNNVGFERWNKIYSESDEVNKVQLDIRTGHAVTVDKVLGWVDEDGTAKAGETFCDAGCGVGSLAIPLAQRGATVIASDISEAMQTEAASRAAAAGVSERTTFSTSDLEALSGKYDTVTCIDVMIHYPPEKMAEMVKHLGSVADKRLIISFAPDTWHRSRLYVRGEGHRRPPRRWRWLVASGVAVPPRQHGANLLLPSSAACAPAAGTTAASRNLASCSPARRRPRAPTSTLRRTS